VCGEYHRAVGEPHNLRVAGYNGLMNTLSVAAVVSVLLTTPLAAQPAGALSTARDLERLAPTRSFWPGFDPLAIPLAIYDGKRTWLFRHPNRPPDFEGSSISSIRSDVREGRHPAVTANSSADINGVATATLLIDGSHGQRTARELAATAIHEAFHVFQRKQHPTWQANEGDLVLYPIEDARLLVLRRLETEALRRALATTGRARAACFGRLAVDYRTKRFAAMDSSFAAYERGTELNEGLAAYVQLLALGRASVDIPREEFPAADVRLRSYTIGPAIAFLLDRIRPRWQHSLERHDRQKLDEVLAGALVGAPPSPKGGCAIPAIEVATITRQAERDAANVVTSRVARRRAFDTRTGWRVIILAGEGKPLWPQGFDPLNIERLDDGLLHTRFLSLGNDACKATAIDENDVDIEAFTEGFGPHPLFNGVKRAIIAGLEKPLIARDGDRVTITTSGLQLECARADVHEAEGEVTVTP
jgi:hypothetical protein